MTFHVGWPQGIVLGLILAELVMVGILHGRPQTSRWNVMQSAARDIVCLLLLYWGGFFRG